MRWHLLAIGDQSKSNIPARRWIARALSRRIREGKVKGHFFSKESGKKASIGDYDPSFRAYIRRTMDHKPRLFHKNVLVEDYSLRRSPRRGATVSATNNGIPQPVIDEINRWRTKENARGSEAGLPLRQVYTSVRYMLSTQIVFSQSH